MKFWICMNSNETFQFLQIQFWETIDIHNRICELVETQDHTWKHFSSQNAHENLNTWSHFLCIFICISILFALDSKLRERLAFMDWWIHGWNPSLITLFCNCRSQHHLGWALGKFWRLCFIEENQQLYCSCTRIQ